MAFTYTAGLRIRTPEPMPECVSGETPQQYFARVLSLCQIESATTSENNSGDSAPTPFNLGQIQADVARNTEAIDALETQVGDLSTSVAAATDKVLSGTVTYPTGATTVSVAFPDSGSWNVVVTPAGQALSGLYLTVSSTNFVATFSAAGAAGSLQWVAIKSS